MSKSLHPSNQAPVQHSKGAPLETGGKPSALRSSLRGVSFAAGEAALAPSGGGVQLKAGPGASGKGAKPGATGASPKGGPDHQARFEKEPFYPMLTELGRQTAQTWLDRLGAKVEGLTTYDKMVKDFRQQISYPFRANQYWQSAPGSKVGHSAAADKVTQEIEADKRHTDFRYRFSQEPFFELLTEAGTDISFKYWEGLGYEGMSDYDAAVKAFQKEIGYPGKPNTYWQKKTKGGAD